MLKHVSLSPWRSRSDSVSLASSGGTSSCGSPSPGHTPPPSRASSCASLGPLSSFSTVDAAPQQTTIKVYANCLRPDIEYKTLSITYETTCREVVQNLLNKYRMRHRDPRLFYLTMEVTVRRANVSTVLRLDEDARPAVLQSCHPRGDSRFSLQMRRGGLVKVYDSALMSGSQYKSLLISEKTTVDELIQMLLSCYNSSERVEQFSLYEVCEDEEYQRKLHPDDSPLKVTQRWTSPGRHLRIRRNPDYNPLGRKNIWTSDTSIALAAMSRLQLQNSATLQLLDQNTTTNNNIHHYQHHNPHHQHHSHHHHHRQHHLAYRSSHVHGDSNNNNNNKLNNKVTSQSILTSLTQQQQQQSARIVVPHPSQLPQYQQQQQQMKSLPTTPLLSKHISTSSYADYENYLFI